MARYWSFLTSNGERFTTSHAHFSVPDWETRESPSPQECGKLTGSGAMIENLHSIAASHHRIRDFQSRACALDSHRGSPCVRNMLAASRGFQHLLCTINQFRLLTRRDRRKIETEWTQIMPR